MVWAAFSWFGVGPICRVNGRMDQHLYRDILCNTMKPFAVQHMPDPFIFMQDNDPKHTARSVKQWFSSENINVLDWPAQSPDLNPIENLWADVEIALEKKVSKNAEELFQNVKEIWQSIPVERCQHLVASLPKRCKAVLEAKGYPTKY